MQINKILFFLVFISIIFFIPSCSNDQEEIGYEKTDIEIEKRQLINVNGPGWTPCEASNLQIFIPECLNAVNAPVWNNGILDALANYNNVPESGVNFVITNDAENADIVFTCFQNGTCFGGSVDPDFVNTGMSGIININSALDLVNCGCPAGLDVCSATHIVMHEMAHALGFFHNNSNHQNAVLVEGTPDNNDPNSIINGGDIIDWCNLTCNFSNFDIIALQEIYPCACRPRLRITGPTFLCNIGQEATYCIPDGFEIENWSIPGNMTEISREGNCITVSLNTFNGYEPIRLSINEGGCINEYELYVNTHEYPNFDIEYNGPICFGDVVQFNILPLPSHQNLRAIHWEVTYGGLNIMSSNNQFAVVEATYGSGPAQICATVVNDCGNEKTYCINVTIQRESDCSGDGELPNPK